MDVTCPRCQTDYEFDDALVSERGTTVKCTNCGHQFRVFRPRASAAGSLGAPTPELWRIERNEGESLELRSLVELQRAIRAGRVSRADLLRRGDGPARRVGDIPELDPFFPAPRPEGAPNTLPLPSVAEPAAPPQVDVAQSRVPAHTPAYGKAPPGTQIAIGTGTIRPPGAVPPPPPRTGNSDRPPAPRLPTPLGISSFTPSTPNAPNESSAPHRPVTPLPPPRTPPPVQHTPNRNERVSLNDLAMQANIDADPPTMRRGSDSRAMTSKPPVDTSPATGDPYDSLFPPPTQKKKGGVGWIIAVLLLGGAVALGATVFRPQIQRLFAGNPASSSSNDGARLDRELAAGDRAKSDGDYAGAREAYLRATVISEKSLAAWDGLCTAESELASVHWLAALATGSTLERDQGASVGASAGRSCARWGELARATDEGSKKVAGDLRTVRAAAAQGDGGGVRLYLPSHPGEPVLEALSMLADATKKDAASVSAAAKAAAVPMAKADLKTLAAPADVALAALVAGMAGTHTRLQDAIAELERRAPRHMLLDTLRGLSSGAPAVATDAGVVDAAVADSGHPAAEAGTKIASTGPVATGPDEPSTPPTGDYRDLNKKGYAALAAGDPSKAETLFKAALAQHPGDTDALYGLGQIARSRGDSAGAISYFKQALDTSAGFAPARLALADAQWASGQQAEAIKNYQLYLDRVSEGSGADRARARIGASKGEPTDTTPTPKPAPKPEPKEE